jgi:nicotinamidase-related amidase
MIDWNRSVLASVDMQNGFVNGNTRQIIPNILRLVNAFESANLPVAFTRFLNAPDSPYERLIHWTRFREPPETDIVSELLPHARTVFDKNYYSALTPEFARWLRQRDVRDLILCGIATDGCVLKTAADAFEQGLTPWVVQDACASHAGEEVHQAGVLLLGRFIGRDQLIKTEDVLESLAHRAA